jgi:hypothetical protein
VSVLGRLLGLISAPAQFGSRHGEPVRDWPRQQNGAQPWPLNVGGQGINTPTGQMTPGAGSFAGLPETRTRLALGFTVVFLHGSGGREEGQVKT